MLRVVLNVAAFDEVVAFYRDLLGLPLVGGWDRGATDRGALLQVADGGVVEVVGHGDSYATPDYAEMAIAIELTSREEVEALHRRASTSQPRAVVAAPVHRSWGHYSFSLRDPVDLEIAVYATVAAP
jgi:catechol 2,3-dioxygenase-like lactoylglutathione lyase family enzyme